MFFIISSAIFNSRINRIIMEFKLVGSAFVYTLFIELIES